MGARTFATLSADGAVAASTIAQRRAGRVTVGDRDLDGFEQGAKGVDGGAVRLVGSFAG